jgi:hypothetical protein
MKVIVFLMMAAGQVQAATYSQFYTDASGRKMETSEALMSSVKGDEVYLCKAVEAKASKSGTSIGLHAVKKPKSN